MIKVKEKLCDKKGESLLESVVSIVIFSIFMLTITFMIGVASNITINADESAEKWQATVNQAVAEDYQEGVESKMELSFISEAEGKKIGVKTQVRILKGDGVFAFYPLESWIYQY